MPLIRIISSAEPAKDSEEALLQKLSALLAKQLGKPESYVMTCLEPRARMTFAGSNEPACYVEVKNVGVFAADRTAPLSAAITEVLASGLHVARGRIYIEFSDARPHMWGYDGDTFA
jgi:phenylpyruvate tautomerase PptA (4-oxalocrotonate tautomerase family)